MTTQLRWYVNEPDNYSVTAVNVIGSEPSHPAIASTPLVFLSVASGIQRVHPDWLHDTEAEARTAALVLVRERLAAVRAELRSLSHRELQLEMTRVDVPQAIAAVAMPDPVITDDDESDLDTDVYEPVTGEPVAAGDVS